MKTVVKQMLSVCCVALMVTLFSPAAARADASASSELSFTGISVTPSVGTFTIVTNWSGAAFAQATLTSEFNTGTTPTASATGDFSTASGSADATVPNGQSAASGSIIGVDGSDNAAGQGWVESVFMITGGSGSVDTTFSTDISGSLNVLTDALGELAQAETVYSLEVNGDAALFDDRFFSVGPNGSDPQTFSTTISSVMTLQYDTQYLLFAEADSEISVVNSVPEPQPVALMAAGILGLVWLGRKRLRRQVKGASVAALMLGAAGISHATYIGGDAPSQMNDCGPAPTMEAGGTIDMSLSEGDLLETFPLTEVMSDFGPTIDMHMTYNSYDADGSRAQIDSGLGAGWTHSYNSFLFQQRGSFFEMGPDGRVTMYHFGFPFSWTSDAGYYENITPQTDGSYIVSDKYGNTRRYAYIPGTQLLVSGTVYRLTQLTDRHGNVTTLNYTGGLLTQIVDAYGRTVTLGYTSQHLTTITDPMGHTTQFQYDPKFRTPIRITDPSGRVTRYTYNSQYQMTKKIDGEGRTYFYLYRNLEPWAVVDGNGHTWFALANTNNWAVDRNSLALNLRRVYIPSTSTSTDGRGNTWRYQYDTNGYITRATAPDGATTSYGYDSQSRKLRAVTNADGMITRYQYDAHGNRTNITAGLTVSGGDQSPITTTYTYEPIYNQVTTVTDPNGRTTTNQYDSHGNRTNETDTLTNSRSWTYDTHGNMLTATDKNGHTTTYSYNSIGGLTNVVDPLGHASHYTRDFMGQPTTSTDQLGRTTTYTYQYGAGEGELVQQTDPLGGSTQYSYDSGNRVTTNIDALGRTTTYDYDTRGRIIETIDPLGHTTTYGYDGNNNRIATTNRNGDVTTYQYDPQNRRTAETDALGNITTYSYDPEGNRTNATDPNGNTTTYTYDALNRRTSATDPLGHTTYYDYAMPGGPPCCSPTIGSPLITRLEDANGHVTFYTYDALNRLTSVIKKQGDTNAVVTPNDAVTTYTYDAEGNRLSSTDPMGNTTTYNYDGLNRRIGMTNAVNDITTYAYDAAGNLITTIAPNGNVTTSVYDGLNRRTTTYDSVGIVATNAYDAVGNLISTTDANGNTTAYQYDSLNRRTNTTDALGRLTVTVYDAVGNETTNIDRNGYPTRHDYDASDRRTDTIDRLGNITRYSYDAVGNLTNVTDANGRTTTYTYDGLNRRATETYPDAAPNTIYYTYDAIGNLITRTDQQGRVTTYGYNDLYYRTNRSYSPSGSIDQYTYDLSGRLLSANRDGWVDTYGYDGINRMVYTTKNGQLLTYSYDTENRRVTNAYPSGRILRYDYDTRGRLISGREGANPSIMTYTYDDADRVITRTNGNNVVTTYTYDADNRISSLETSNSTGRVVGFGYAYDYDGNQVYEEKRHMPLDSEAYGYDAMNRLTDYRVGTLSGGTVPSPALEKSYTLDPLENWSSVVSNSVTENRTHGPANELLTIDSQSFSYDTSGNLIQDTLYVYSYDEENRLTQIQRIADAAIVGRYFYDALGRRVIAMVNPAGSAVTNVYFYDHAWLVEEQDANGTPRATYVYGRYTDELVTVDRAGQRYYYHQNSRWSTHALTDASGNVVERYTYDAYGEPIVLDPGYSARPLNAWGTPHSLYTNYWLFTGRQLDEEAGLFYYRARHYDTVKGRFLQRDPLGYVEGINLYEYVQDNPVNLLDPFGTASSDSSASAKELARQAAELLSEFTEDAAYISDLYTRASKGADRQKAECVRPKMKEMTRGLETMQFLEEQAQALADKGADLADIQRRVRAMERARNYARELKKAADECVGNKVAPQDPGPNIAQNDSGPRIGQDKLPASPPSVSSRRNSEELEEEPVRDTEERPSYHRSSEELEEEPARDTDDGMPEPSIEDPCPPQPIPQTLQPDLENLQQAAGGGDDGVAIATPNVIGD